VDTLYEESSDSEDETCYGRKKKSKKSKKDSEAAEMEVLSSERTDGEMQEIEIEKKEGERDEDEDEEDGAKEDKEQVELEDGEQEKVSANNKETPKVNILKTQIISPSNKLLDFSKLNGPNLFEISSIFFLSAI
jgi:hypothetical protein